MTTNTDTDTIVVDGFSVRLRARGYDRRGYGAKTRVYGACDDLVADLNATQPRWVLYRTDENSPAEDVAAEQEWLVWRDATKKVAGIRLRALLAKLAGDADTLGREGVMISPAAAGSVRFSFKAGCSCGCSPGFIMGGTVFHRGRPVDLFISEAG